MFFYSYTRFTDINIYIYTQKFFEKKNTEADISHTEVNIDFKYIHIYIYIYIYICRFYIHHCKIYIFISIIDWNKLRYSKMDRYIETDHNRLIDRQEHSKIDKY